MQISKLHISNFRCFGPTPTDVDLSRLTCFIGTNGSGKSAILQALAKLFGIVSSDRSIHPSDFHVPQDQVLEDAEERSLYIEARIEFPELTEYNESHGVPECFNQMIIESPGSTPFCRVRLEAVWQRGNTPGGIVDCRQFWITTAADDFGDHTINMRGADRSIIQVHYVPANRDPSQQIRSTSGSVMNRLLNAVEWSEAIKESVKDAANDIRAQFDAEAGVSIIKGALGTTWSGLSDGKLFQSVQISPLSRRFEDVLSKVEATFQPSPDGGEETSERLSDGLRSLFYLTLVKTVFDVEDRLIQNTATGISSDRLKPPALTILAIEEPENHLAPHYLARIIATCRGMLDSPRAQCVITSHSPSVLRRIDPLEVRYLRLSEEREAIVNRISLPEDGDDAFKYIKQAIQSHPEVYFSKAVILGEGDSEEVILPKIAEALDVDLDGTFVSVVPLGGRHVNHLWKLLNELGIPYATLLDFDRFRGGGGWGRIKYVCKQLLALGITPKEGVGVTEYDNMHLRADDFDAQKQWITDLESHRIFFSVPLDIDYMMLKAFPAAYHALAPDSGGPQIPDADDPDKENKIKAAFAAVVKKDVSAITTFPSIQEPSKLFWYRYLFLGRGKPSTHSLALLEIDAEDLVSACPAVLKSLIYSVQAIIPSHEVEPTEDA